MFHIFIGREQGGEKKKVKTDTSHVKGVVLIKKISEERRPSEHITGSDEGNAARVFKQNSSMISCTHMADCR